MCRFARQELIHEGKTNRLYKTDFPGYLELEATDRISAGNGKRKGEVAGKGIANNHISTAVFRFLEKNEIPTHYVCQGNNEASKIVTAAEMIPLEVICRFFATGSFCRRYECKEGLEFEKPLIEFTFKSDSVGDPPIDRKTILALNEKTLIKDEKELKFIESTTTYIGALLCKFYERMGVRLIDFKIEFGRERYGEIILCDEISPDTCRLVDIETGEKMDASRFRENLGDIGKGYIEILRRLKSVTNI